MKITKIQNNFKINNQIKSCPKVKRDNLQPMSKISFGNNFNNRVEESIGSAVDFWKAYKEGAIGSQPEPFLGWIIYVEKTQKSDSPVKNSSPHFPCFPEFKGTSYLDRYNLLCQKLVQERLYRCAALVASERNDTQYATYSDKSDILNLFKQLYIQLALSCAK